MKKQSADDQKLLTELLNKESWHPDKQDIKSPQKSPTNETNAQENNPNIGSFIEQNDKIIQVLGVFIALTAFATILPIKVMGYILAFIFLSCTILIWLELWGRFPKNGTTALAYFENFLVIGGLALIAYFFLDFRAVWREYLFILIATIPLFITSRIIKRYNIFNRLFNTSPGKLRPLRYTFGIIIIIVNAFISFYISYLLAKPINDWLDSMRQYLDTINNI
jgi:hypothetical protein